MPNRKQSKQSSQESKKIAQESRKPENQIRFAIKAIISENCEKSGIIVDMSTTNYLTELMTKDALQDIEVNFQAFCLGRIG